MNLDSVVQNPVRKLLYAGTAVLVFSAVMGSYFVVDPTERAGVRFMGTVRTPQPLKPGVHAKIPFLESVDKLTVSQQKIHVDPFSVNTIDNQPITLDINIIYRTPDAAVFKNLYEIGRSGPDDITPQMVAVVRDRVSRIIAGKNTITISANREAIQSEITTSVHDAVNQLFGIDVESLQISNISYSAAFMASNELAVKSKNDAVAEENRKKVIEYQAQQRVIAAEGVAREQVAAAEGQAKVLVARSTAEAQQVEIAARAAATAQITRAEAEARQVKIAADASAMARKVQADAERNALEAIGQGQGAQLKSIVEAHGGPDKYLESLRIGATAKWNGSVPTTVMNMGSSGNTGGIPLLMTMPAPTNK